MLGKRDAGQCGSAGLIDDGKEQELLVALAMVR
jgi:hypothetical protein